MDTCELSSVSNLSASTTAVALGGKKEPNAVSKIEGKKGQERKVSSFQSYFTIHVKRLSFTRAVSLTRLLSPQMLLDNVSDRMMSFLCIVSVVCASK